MIVYDGAWLSMLLTVDLSCLEVHGYLCCCEMQPDVPCCGQMLTVDFCCLEVLYNVLSCCLMLLDVIRCHKVLCDCV